MPHDRISLYAAAILVAATSSTANAAGVTTLLANQGKAAQPIIVAAGASKEVRDKASVLASYLQRICGAEFVVQEGKGKAGIVVGRAIDFPDLEIKTELAGEDPTKREDYLLRSHDKGVYLFGASDLAVSHAVWDFLHRLGYRQYFPGPDWEIVPRREQLQIAVDAFEHPSYYSRRIWYGFGAWDHAKEPYRDWCEKNRCVQGIELNTGHAYDGILARNKAAFAAHPEFFGLVNGERKSTKFCISNPELRALVVVDALAQFAKDTSRQSVSVDPSDGGGWCECEECAKLGSVSDRAVILANAVAEGVARKHAGKYVGMYAYNQHSPPPSIAVHPNVVISVATAFISGGYSVDELLAGWSKRASMLGIREYYSVNTWDRDLPGAARGAKLDYLRTSIPHFHQQSARFLSAESSDNWGPNGLGYYLASRMLWNVDEAERVPDQTSEFLEHCFGSAKTPMTKFYRLLDGTHRQPLSDDLIGRMYGLLEEASDLTNDSAVRARLAQLTLYTRYVELWLDYSVAKDAARQAAFEALIRHAYRMRGTMLVHAYALYRDLASRDKSVSIPDEARWNVPEPKNPWKSSLPFTSEEVEGLRKAGIASRKLLDFEPVDFSRELVPAARLDLKSEKVGTMGIYSRSPRTYFTWAEKAPANIALQITGGLVYTNRGGTKVDLYPAAETEGKSVAHAEVAPDRTAQKVTLETTISGLQRIEILAGGGANTTWEEGTPMTIESSIERPGGFHGRWSLYFYVPHGTKIVGGFSAGEGKLKTGSGSLAHTFDRKPGFFSIPVPAGEAGRLWKFEGCAGDKMLMTVPPFLARSAAELLLPREVVESDTQR